MPATQILWTPAGQNLPSLGAKALVDVTDGDTPNIRMPIRMLSIDTPEVTARSEAGAVKVDTKFLELAAWIEAGKAPVSRSFADYILPRLQTGQAGSLQYAQGKSASSFHKELVTNRLQKPNSTKRRNLFVRMSEVPFDTNGRLLAYVAPSYSTKELNTLSRKERATFNLDLVASGWAAPFIIYPNIPGELDLPMMIEAAQTAKAQQKGQYQDGNFLPGYEYRMCEKLFSITRKLVAGETLNFKDQLKWRSRYCADMRDRKLYGPEQYMTVAEPFRLWIWPEDLQTAIGKLNLIPQ